MKFRISENKGKNQIAQFIYDTTDLLIMHVNEGNEWPSDLSPAAFYGSTEVKPVRVLQLERPFDLSKSVAN